MALSKSGLLLALSFLLCLSLLPSSTEAAEAILLQDVRVLTLYRDRMTTGRRTSPIPQLQCSGEACGYFQPSVVQCINQGFDGRDFQWKCSAQMDDWYRFGAVTVGCEGYTNPEDPYILVGSCGLEYELQLTAKGREHHYGNSRSYQSEYTHDATPSTFGTIFYLIWFVVFAIIIFSCLGSVFGSNRPAAPYATAAPYPTAGGVYPDPSAPPAYASYPSYAHPAPPSGGGFWSGAATGGFLGYLFGRNRGNNYGYGYGYPRTTGWGAPSYPNTTYAAPRSGFSSSSSSSSSHTSEGYGGTRRR